MARCEHALPLRVAPGVHHRTASESTDGMARVLTLCLPSAAHTLQRWSLSRLAAEACVQAAAQLAQLQEASRLNPFVGEPHLVRAQILLTHGEWDEASAAATKGVGILADWATSWDKRMPWNAWLNWGRSLALQAAFKEWPDTHGGIESLGATHPRMRFRKLNTSRNLA